MLVKDVAFKILDVLARERASVQGLDLVLHDVTVLLDVVLLVELLAEGHDVLAGDIGVGVELGAGGGVGRGDVVADEVALLAQVKAGVELLDVGHGHLLVDGHQALLDLTPDLTAGDLVVNVEVLRDRDNHSLGTFLASCLVGLAYAVHQFDLVVLLIRAIGLAYSYIHIQFILFR